MNQECVDKRFVTQMSRTLDRLGIKHGKLRRLSSHVWADKKRVVVKIAKEPDGDSARATARHYLEDLQQLEVGGVRCEPRLHLKPVEFTRGVWGVVLGWVKSDLKSGEPQGVSPKEWGAYVRAVHDVLSPADSGVQPGWVRCPNDWAGRNLVVSGSQPVIVDLDNMNVGPRGEQAELAAGDLLPCVSDEPFQQALEEFMEGYGPY